MSEFRPIEILLVDDDIGDVVMTREALDEGKVCNRLHVVGDGLQAINFLRRTGEHARAPRPDLILLDLLLPGRDGHQVLTEIRGDLDLRSIPVVVLTTSPSEAEMLRRHTPQADAYVTKPIDVARFFNVVQQIDGFYLAVVRIPDRASD